MTYELKKCPFCGGEPKMTGNRYKRVICPTCGAEGGDAPVPSKAAESWNRRTAGITCEHCKHYRKDLKWCDKLSTYLDKDDNPTLEETKRWIAFNPDDFCSLAEVADGE